MIPTAVSRSSLAAALLSSTLPALLAAQSGLTGVVHDSLAGRALPGATVQLVRRDAASDAPRTTLSDSAGRYRFAEVAPGRYLLGFTHPRLDSLGIEAPVRPLVVGTGPADQRADLALPGAGSVAAAICGARRDSSGVLIGRVRDPARGEPFAAGAVLVRWVDIVVDAAGVRRVPQALRAPLNEDRRFAACGLPTGVPVAVQAVVGDSLAPSDSSGVVELTIPAASPLRYSDLYVGRAGGAARTAAVAGRVLGPDRRPLAGARVFVRGTGAADSIALTRLDGSFRLGALPGGTHTVEAIAIGYSPAKSAVNLRPDSTAALDLTLGPRVQTLEAVSVYAAPMNPNSGFVKRMNQGFGRFYSGETLQRSRAPMVTTFFATVPGLRPAAGRNGRTSIVGRFGCAPLVYLDGFLVPEGMPGIDSYVSMSQVGGIEVYPDAMSAPVQYARGDCATVLIWTKESLW